MGQLLSHLPILIFLGPWWYRISSQYFGNLASIIVPPLFSFKTFHPEPKSHCPTLLQFLPFPQIGLEFSSIARPETRRSDRMRSGNDSMTLNRHHGRWNDQSISPCRFVTTSQLCSMIDGLLLDHRGQVLKTRVVCWRRISDKGLRNLRLLHRSSNKREYRRTFYETRSPNA
jgi:hypothetical protein